MSELKQPQDGSMANHSTDPALRADQEPDIEKCKSIAESAHEPDETKKKPLAFYFAFLSLVIMVLIVSIDSTALAVAIPVRTTP